MSVSLYMDVHVPGPVTTALRRRNVNVLRSQEDGATRWSDERLLDRASVMGRVLVSQDADLLRIASERQASGVAFSGVIYAHQLSVGIGDLVRDLELLALCCDAPELANQVTYLPLP